MPVYFSSVTLKTKVINKLVDFNLLFNKGADFVRGYVKRFSEGLTETGSRTARGRMGGLVVHERDW